MVSHLEELDAVVLHEINDSVRLGETARPRGGSEVSERLGLANASKRIAQNRLDELEHPDGYPPIRFYPET
jgi:hypothetical protein